MRTSRGGGGRRRRCWASTDDNHGMPHPDGASRIVPYNRCNVTGIHKRLSRL